MYEKITDLKYLKRLSPRACKVIQRIVDSAYDSGKRDGYEEALYSLELQEKIKAKHEMKDKFYIVNNITGEKQIINI